MLELLLALAIIFNTIGIVFVAWYAASLSRRLDLMTMPRPYAERKVGR